MSGFDLIETEGVPVKAWTRGVELDEKALRQLANAAQVPIVAGPIAVMPDVHWGIGATVGSVVPTLAAIIPAAVGVDIGCGMAAVRTSLEAAQLPDDLKPLRNAIERAVPHGRSSGRARNDRGSWGDVPDHVASLFKKQLGQRFERVCAREPRLARTNNVNHLGTLGTGNHFIELCLDEDDRVWVMLHSGSRGVGNAIGTRYIERAKELMGERLGSLPDGNLAWLAEGSPDFEAYVDAVGWAQDFARWNRRVMMDAVIAALRRGPGLPAFELADVAVNCHHNYVQKERHFGREVWLTRKGAVRAGKGELGIIPGSMGARSFIVRGKGNADSYQSCSHGAGRRLSRTEAKKRFSVKDHERATAHVECRKDAAVIDETPMAYKDIDAVMAAQSDLVEVVHTLRQVVCVKG